MDMTTRQKQFHIQLSQEDCTGRYCIMPGDPKRCEAIAKLMDNPVYIHMNREFCTWKGTLLGEDVMVVSSGIGGPSASIAIEELAELGVDTFIRAGTCGGIRTDVCSGDIVVATGAVRMEGTTREYAPIEFPAVATFEVVGALKEAAEQMGKRCVTGVVQCKDSFYGQHAPHRMPVADELEYKWKAWKRLGVLASEMESAALFVVGAARNLRTGACFHVVWNQEREKVGLPQQEDHDTSAAVRVAVEGMKKLIAQDKAQRQKECIK